MKTFFKSKLISVVLLSFTIFSCKKIDNSSTTAIPNQSLTQRDKELITIFSKIGEIHNQGMEYAYRKLRKIADDRKILHLTTDTSRITLEQVNELVTEYIIDSLQATGFTSYKPFYYKDTILRDRTFFDSSFIKYIQLSTQSDLNSDFKSALADFETFWRNDSVNVDLSKYDSIIAVKVPTISDTIDKMAFICGVSTGKSSAQYWEANAAKWDSLANDLGGDHHKINLVCCAGKDIIFADIAGGVGGFFRGAVVGAAGGTIVVPGIGTVTGATAGAFVGGAVGGVGGSAVEAIHSLIQWIITW